MEYVECGCVNTCRMINTPQRLNNCENCKPVCRCPKESYELNGNCVDKEECLAKDTEMDNKEKIKRKCKFNNINKTKLSKTFALLYLTLAVF